MDKWIRIIYIENGELKKVLKKINSIKEALDELDKVMRLPITEYNSKVTITEFSFYHN